MTGPLIEGGIYFLLLFTPFAFGGVETWAQGVFQIVAGLVVAVWIWSRPDPASVARDASPARGWLKALWIFIGLFALLALFQLAPLPPAWMQRISPSTHDFYARSLPGYAQGRDFDAKELAAWLLDDQAGRIPDAAAGRIATPPDPPLAGEGIPTRASSRRTLTLSPHETRQRIVLLLGLIGLFAVVVGRFRNQERLTRLLSVCVFSAVALSLFGILQKLTWNGKLFWVREGTYAAAFGPFVNQSNYAAFAGAALPVAVCMALNALRHLENGRPGAASRLSLWGFATATIGCGIFYSLSRGGIIAAMLSLGFVAAMLLYYGRGAKELALIATLGVAAAGFLIWIGPEKVIERIGTLSEAQSLPSVTSRVAVWGRCLDLIASSPWLGSGLGTFRFAFLRFAPPGEGWWTQAHNEYIELICDTGLVGGALFLGGLAAWLGVVGRAGLFGDRTERYHYIGAVAGIAGLLLHSGVTSNLQLPANALILTVLGGALVCLVLQRSTGRTKRRWQGRTAAAPQDAPPAVRDAP